MLENLLTRASILMEQNRIDEAINILLSQYGNMSEDYSYILLLCQCHIEKGDYKKAKEMAERLILLSPDNPFSYYFKSTILWREDKTLDAEKYLKKAIQIDPNNPDFFGQMAAIQIELRKFEEGLQQAEIGLSIDASNLFCLNMRTKALIKLGRKEVEDTIYQTLAEDPENEFSHINVGWSLLEKGDNAKALIHFKEALKVNPNSEAAKAGLVEALKARYIFYKWFLKYTFWMNNLPPKTQWGVIIGGVIGFRVVGKVFENTPILKPFLIPLVVLYLSFVLSTWIINPLSNLLLRLNSFGKFALTKDEIRASNLSGISVIIALISGIAFLFSFNLFFLVPDILGLTMVVPISGTFNAEGKGRKVLTIYSAILFIIGILAVLAAINTAVPLNSFSNMYIFGFVGFTWVSNIFTIK